MNSATACCGRPMCSQQKAAPIAQLIASPPASADFAFLNLLLGDVAPAMAATSGTKLSMLELEAAQVAAKCGVETRTESLNPASRRQVLEEMLARPDLSKPLRAALEKVGASGGVSAPAPPPKDNEGKPPPTPADILLREHFLKLALSPPVPQPPYRRLRIYAYDPGQATDPSLFDVSVANVTTQWELLDPGPVGEYLEVVDVDPASNACSPPSISINRACSPRAVSRHRNPITAVPPADGLRGRDAHDRAFSSARSAGRRCGRAANLRMARYCPTTGSCEGSGSIHTRCVRRTPITIPRRLRSCSAISRLRTPAALSRAARALGVVSHDIVAHETTHALLDGLHPRYSERTNVDMAAFHEAFADIVALFQHFAMPESLIRQIRQAQGDTNSDWTQTGPIGSTIRQRDRDARRPQALRGRRRKVADPPHRKHGRASCARRDSPSRRSSRLS